MNPRYPIYIISKGRWSNPLTSKALEIMRVPYHIVVEPQEYDKYAENIDSNKILQLPFSNLGLGSIPARNWVWDHSKSANHERHWILDDNIRHFCRMNGNERWNVETGGIFLAAEDFVDRYENVALAGFNYIVFPKQSRKKPPFQMNTRIYSCILIKNDIPIRWRGKYNEDTDISLRALKLGYCTILFDAFLIDKATTMTISGGNTDELYAGNGRIEMAKSLANQHPYVTTITKKWGRWQHHVDYRPFRKNRLLLKRNAIIPNEINNYGMKLIEVDRREKHEKEN